MPKNSFVTGDIVKLKSGGPEMTVRSEHMSEPGKVTYNCQWFAGKKLESGVFPADSLEQVKAKASGK